MRHLLTLLLFTAALSAQDGAAVYKQHCATCHDTPAGRIPPFSALRAMDAPFIIRSLETGPMKSQGAGLTVNERYAVVAYLAHPASASSAPTVFCQGSTASNAPPSAHWSAWGVDLANTRFQKTAAAGLTAADVSKLKLKWAFGVGEGATTHSQPAVAAGHVFTADLTGALFSLDAATGCVQWKFEAGQTIRSAIVIGANAIYFGDQQGNAYAVDTTSGKLLWKVHVDQHFAALITGAPQLHGEVLYVPVASFEEALPASPNYECCTFRGSVVALEAATGHRLWQTYTIPEPPHPTTKNSTGIQMHGPSGAAAWSTPTYDEKQNILYVATGDNYSEPSTPTSDAVLALDAKTGRILWSKQLTAGDIYNNGCVTPTKTNCPATHGQDFDFGQPPILVSLANGHRALVIGQKSGMAHALDPDRQGAILWQTRVGPGGALGGIQWGSATDGEAMYVAESGLQITVALDSSAPQGFTLGLDPSQGGGLSALRLTTGEVIWTVKPTTCGDRKHCSPAQSAAVTAIPGIVFSGSVDGHLRAYAAATGKVVWDVDTACDYQTVNGQKAHGGSLDVAGPVIAGGTLYINSGYGQWGGMPGNVLLAFSVQGK